MDPKQILQRENIARQINDYLIPTCSNGNADASAYLKRIFYVVRLMDDLADKDVEIQHKEILKAFSLLLFDLPTNPFYLANQSMLTGMHIIAYNAWQDANIWEQDTDSTKKMYAHVIRDFICELFPLTAYLTGGEKLMRSVSPEVRSIFLKELGE